MTEPGPGPTSQPEWFTRALAAPVETISVEVRGTPIAVRVWGDHGPGVVLVHGGAAHSRWWDHIAPMLADSYRVAALDLSGHGDSGRRAAYKLDVWAEEVMAVAPVAGIAGPPVVIGHSMGGWVALTAGARHDDDIAGVVTIDSPIRQRTPEEEAAVRRRAFGPLRRYPSQADAINRFRTVPEQPTYLPYILRHVARTSVIQSGDAWVWKFDPRIFDRPRPTSDLLAAVWCRVGVFRAECGLVTPDIGADIYAALGRIAPVVEIPLAGHHPMLDQPLALVVGLRTILADWRHSTAHPRPVARDAVRAARSCPRN
jgi:pimeloyl-ACP methyl ester carboxylesterase